MGSDDKMLNVEAAQHADALLGASAALRRETCPI